MMVSTVSQTKKNLLTINGGSSSIKFCLYQSGASPRVKLTGKVERIGLSDCYFTFNDTLNDEQGRQSVDANDFSSAISFLIGWLEKQIDFTQLSAIGHRVVHGMRHSDSEMITQDLLDELRQISSYDPDHLPGEIELIETFRQQYPQLPQVACFDTAFHSQMPRVAKMLPIPRRFDARHIQRYGFHGLSYAYLMTELVRIGDPSATTGKVILAHLGNGASLAAVRDGRSIDTSMGFTPASGLVMSTRCGDLDPGVAWYMMQNENLTGEQFKHLINRESGLLGISETSSDMRDLISREATDERAAEAVALFCYQVKKWTGAYAAALGGLDTLVFAGGIGENSAVVRARICEGLEFLGIQIDEECNQQHAAVISAEHSRVVVRVMHTDEELMIAKSVCHVIGLSNENAK
jgi:acetate kinase